MEFDTEMMQGWVEKGSEFLISYGMNVVGAIVLLIIGLYISKVVSRGVYKGMSRSGKIDEMLCRFLSSLVRYAIVLFTGIAVLSQFGVQTASLVAVMGAAGLAVGLALQGTLSHVASGVMLLIFRPFKIGDFVEVAGYAGTITEVGLFVTEMKTPDNVHIIIPNGQVWDSSVKNFSHNGTRRVDWVFGIAYEDNMDDAMAVMKGLLEADKRVLQDEGITIAVNELADSSVNFVVRAWCKSSDYWDLKWDTTKAVKEAFDAKNISIPYPQQVVHMVKEG